MAEKCARSLPIKGSGGLYRRCPHPAGGDGYCGVHSPRRRAERAKRRGPTKKERRRKAVAERDQALAEVMEAAREAATICTHPRLGEAVLTLERLQLKFTLLCYQEPK